MMAARFCFFFFFNLHFLTTLPLNVTVGIELTPVPRSSVQV